MAYSTEKNQVFMERLKNAAVAFQNLREEAQRLRDWYFDEISPAAVDDEDFVDTSIATVDEAKMMINYLGDFQSLNDNVALSADARRVTLIPFISDTPA